MLKAIKNIKNCTILPQKKIVSWEKLSTFINNFFLVCSLLNYSHSCCKPHIALKPKKISNNNSISRIFHGAHTWNRGMKNCKISRLYSKFMRGFVFFFMRNNFQTYLSYTSSVRHFRLLRNRNNSSQMTNFLLSIALYVTNNCVIDTLFVWVE